MDAPKVKIITRLVWVVGILLAVGFAAVYLNHGFFPFNSPIFNRASQTDKPTTPEQDRLIRKELVSEESAIIDVVDHVSPAVVSIIIETVSFDYFAGPQAFEEGIGTGFIVDADGIIVTNSHVVAMQGDYSVVLKDGETYDVKKIHLDPMSDLAILEIDAENLPTVGLGDSDNLQVGQRAVAIGNALGEYQNTVTVGVVSGIARPITASSGFGGDAKTYENVIQTDAALNPGNSGGPLLNSSGEVIGINVATTRSADNISFAVPVNTLKPILDGFLQEGRIIRPYLGVSYTMIPKKTAELRRLPEGAFVHLVVVDSPADEAGVERGDIIIKMAGEQLSTEYPLSKAIFAKSVGDKVGLVIDRGGEELTLETKLIEMPSGDDL